MKVWVKVHSKEKKMKIFKDTVNLEVPFYIFIRKFIEYFKLNFHNVK